MHCRKRGESTAEYPSKAHKSMLKVKIRGKLKRHVYFMDSETFKIRDVFSTEPGKQPPITQDQLGSSLFLISLLTSSQLPHRPPLMTLSAEPISFEHNLTYKHPPSPSGSPKEECNHRGLLTAYH